MLPTRQAIRELPDRPGPRGANLWLLFPSDEDLRQDVSALVLDFVEPCKEGDGNAE